MTEQNQKQPESDARLDEPRIIPADQEDAEALAGGDQPAENVDADADPHVDRQLDKGLKETFPASDPVSINPGAD